MNRIILITGGARSGKSGFAEYLAVKMNKFFKNNRDIAYIATCVPFDDELKERIDIHRQSRSGGFKTYEEPVNIDKAINEAMKNHDIILLDCITTWLGNIFNEKGFDNAETEATGIIERITELFAVSYRDRAPNFDKYLFDKNKPQNIFKLQSKGDKILIVVSNELGLGLVPGDTLSRVYRDVHGRINQRLAANSEAFFYLVSGIPQRVK